MLTRISLTAAILLLVASGEGQPIGPGSRPGGALQAADRLPGSHRTIEQALAGKFGLAAVCEAVGEPTIEVGNYTNRARQTFRVVHLLAGGLRGEDTIELAYTYFNGVEEPIRKGQRVIWLVQFPNPGAWSGAKALADTPENRQAVTAAVRKVSPATSPPARPPPAPGAGEGAARPVPIQLRAQPAKETYGEGQPILVTLTITNGLPGTIRFLAFALKPDDSNGETYSCALVDVYRDGGKSNLLLQRPMCSPPPNLSGPASHPIGPGKTLQVTLDLSKWRLRDGWKAGAYQVTLRADNIQVDARTSVSVVAEPVQLVIGPGPSAGPPPVMRESIRGAALKADLDSFQLVLTYHGPQDKPYYNLTLRLTAVEPRRPTFWPAAQLTKEQAEKIIDHLASEGFLEQAGFHDMGDPQYAGPTYALRAAYGKGFFEQDLGWGPEMLKRLDSLRTVLSDDATDKMALLLGRLQGHRREWGLATSQASSQPVASQPVARGD